MGELVFQEEFLQELVVPGDASRIAKLEASCLWVGNWGEVVSEGLVVGEFKPDGEVVSREGSGREVATTE